jgi:hypothetical protein
VSSRGRTSYGGGGRTGGGHTGGEGGEHSGGSEAAADMVEAAVMATNCR